MNNSFLSMASIGDFDPLNASIPATKVEITVSCRNLLDRDTFSKSDPICVLYTQGMGNKEWREEKHTLLFSHLLWAAYTYMTCLRSIHNGLLS
uniref:Copine C-terminal domain-containing protein n=1 Tax=Periophthalmus magnuspinnatus TaxID=409849 RepID=A0A3B3ZJW5_9GOBI